MTKKEIIRNLKYTREKHKNDRVDTFGTNISLMCKDILDYLEQEPKTEVLDKIRAEIADLDDADYDYEGYYKAVTDALKIIDKYKAESEE